MSTVRLCVLRSVAVFAYAALCLPLAAQRVELRSGPVTFRMELQNGRYGFLYSSQPAVAPDATTGVLLDGSPVSFKKRNACQATSCVLDGRSAAGKPVRLTVTASPNQVELVAEPEPGSDLRFATGGAAPAYGLGDHAVEQARFSTLPDKQFNTDVSGFSDEEFRSGQGITRLVSNFVIYPKQHFAELLIDPTVKVVQTSAQRIVQGVRHTTGPVHLFYFFGDPHSIYAGYLHARTANGAKVLMPKYSAFGVGWEAFGALGWETNAKTVRDSVDRYLAEGYPLRWMVIGSGFWPDKPDTMHETTSFGLWDANKYPDPAGLIRHFRQDDKLDVLLGLRISFIVGGPYSDEGVSHGYFIKKDGAAEVFKGSWPKLPYYLLDAQNPAALDWYSSLVKKWQDFGINGWKEDYFGYEDYPLRDDKVDPTNDRLMAQQQLVIERNGYLASNGDLHRINDFNFNQNQDRGPVNALAYAYSGFPFVYPDIVGGTFGESRFSLQRTPKLEAYMMRNVQWAALHASMGMGEPPWSFRPEVAKVMLEAAQLHARIAPYLYSNARRSVNDGYPWTMTPLPIAFPNDDAAYGRENAKERAYEWLIGDAMLATPLYGEDYETAQTRNVYLPQGRWMDFDTGVLYNGQQTLHDFALPPGKTPLFIGGSGTTLEEVHGTLMAVIYPVATKAEVALTLPASDQAFTVSLKGLAPEATWTGIRVTDGAGKAITAVPVGHGFGFPVSAGAHYQVQARP